MGLGLGLSGWPVVARKVDKKKKILFVIELTNCKTSTIFHGMNPNYLEIVDACLSHAR